LKACKKENEPPCRNESLPTSKSAVAKPNQKDCTPYTPNVLPQATSPAIDWYNHGYVHGNTSKR
jgi:hypothetical protein